MLIATIGLILLTVMQIVVVLMMHYGNVKPQWTRTCYVVATAMGFASAADVVVILDHMNANLAMGIATGAPFVCGQFCLARVTHTRLSPRRWAGILCVAAGLFLLAYGSR